MDKILRINIVSCICSVLLACGCTNNTSIFFLCEKDAKDNYILKWEVFPEKNDVQIEIFCSDNDSIFPKEPLRTEPVNNYITVIESPDETSRSFFKLKIGKTTSGIISNKRFDMDSIQNFRDLGGYFNRMNKQMRWGKIYRSGDLSHISDNDRKELNRLNIKTIIDLRSSNQAKKNPDIHTATSHINIPVEASSFNPEIRKRITDGSFLKGDAIIHTQDCYREIIENHSSQYAHFLDVLCDENNYPVLFHCRLGKDRTGLASFFLLKALDMPTAIIEEDFLLSNEGINKFRLISRGEELSEKMQEAMTVISRADVLHLRYAVYCMKKKSGSIEEYMENELNLDSYKKEKLKSILLYK